MLQLGFNNSTFISEKIQIVRVRKGILKIAVPAIEHGMEGYHTKLKENRLTYETGA